MIILYYMCYPPDVQLVDAERSVVTDVGGKYVYCVRAMFKGDVPQSDGTTKEMQAASHWTCATMIVEWHGTISGTVKATTGPSLGVPGVLVTAVAKDDARYPPIAPGTAWTRIPASEDAGQSAPAGWPDPSWVSSKFRCLPENPVRMPACIEPCWAYMRIDEVYPIMPACSPKKPCRQYLEL